MSPDQRQFVQLRQAVILLSTSTRIAAATVTLSLLLFTAGALASPGFIAETQVTRGSVYAEVGIRFRCGVQYLGHDPTGASDVLRIRLETTTVCTGAAPSIADTKELIRPMSADDAGIESIEYDGESPGERTLRISFSEKMRFDVRPGTENNSLRVRVFLQPAADSNDQADATASTRLQRRPKVPGPGYVINLESWQRPPATADMPKIALPEDKRVFVSETEVDGATWYRVRVGNYVSAQEAARALAELRAQYPGAWIDRADAADGTRVSAAPVPAPVEPPAPAAASDETTDKAAELMNDARHAMTVGELSRAVQIYTKVLQMPPNAHQPDAQEFLALARERNGQIAHAKAEYQRYLEVYPDAEGVQRVEQRLAALLSAAGTRRGSVTSENGEAAPARASILDGWNIRSFLSQYYRRDVNQVNDQEEIVSQSSIYTDLSVDARRRGDRFDFSARLTAGYPSNLMEDERPSSGNDLRLSYAYADLADARSGLRGRIGRQTRNTGGVLGRFDGINLTYALNDRLRFEAVTGRPVYSTARDPVDSRSFQGLSTTFAPFDNNLDFGLFYIEQDIDGLTDRQAVGAELRYFGDNQSLWSIADYDTEFGELGSLFVQGSWRLPANFTVTGVLDRRRSPFLSLGNALVGQQLESFEELRIFFTEEEIRQFALDRSATTTTYTFGLSRPFSPKLSMNVNASISSINATPESGGVPATPDSEYSYYSADVVASSLFTEGDVGILGLRYAVSETTDVYSTTIDTRFPIGRGWRISPRLRVDYREINTDQSTQWIYTPALRVQYRMGRHARFELQTGKQFSTREMEKSDQDRESWFVYAGYQLFY
jgi:tetratricopeptide (TPR) repeat protein